MRRTTRLPRRVAALSALASLLVALAVVVPTLGRTPRDTASAQTLPMVSVMGASQLTAAEIANYYKSVSHPPYNGGSLFGFPPVTIDRLAELFVSEGARYNVRGDVAFAQSIVETLWFNFPSYGQVRANDFNYAGIGACDSCGTGFAFPTPEDGVRAQMQLLRNYADINSRTTTIPDAPVPALWGSNPTTAAFNFNNFSHKGRAPYWNNMGNGNWATSTTYATTVLTVYRQMLAFYGRTPTPETIAEHYNNLGAAGGFLGNALGAEQDVPGGRMRAFQGGNIYWTPGVGAYEVHGAILVRYLEMGGPTSALGFPTTDEANTLAGGRSNGFQGGGIYWTPGTGAHEVYGEIGRLYRALGGPTSPLGFPTSGELGAPGGGGRLNEFQVGAIYWSPATGPHEIRGPMLDKYRSLGGPTSPLGFPTSDVHPVAGGIASSFQGGEIIFSGPTGAHEVHGAIGFVYWLTGSSGGFLGLPTTDETATPGGAGRFNGFQGGAVYWSPATGAHEVHGAINELYQALGGPGGFLGLPIDSERPVPGGAVSRFQGGSIFWSPATGAHELHGAILGAYMFMGGSSSFLGFPVTNETGTPDGVGRFNHFQNGSIYWTFATGAHEVHGAIRDFWANSFWEFGQLGYPTSSELPTPDGVGRFNRFQGGTVTWTPITGAFRS